LRSKSWVHAVESFECASVFFEHTILELGREMAVEYDVERFGRKLLEEMLECFNAVNTGFLPP